MLNLIERIGKLSTKRLYDRWAAIRDTNAWGVFVHPWERPHVEKMLSAGWEKWGDQDVEEMTELLREIHRRMRESSLPRGEA